MCICMAILFAALSIVKACNSASVFVSIFASVCFVYISVSVYICVCINICVCANTYVLYIYLFGNLACWQCVCKHNNAPCTLLTLSPKIIVYCVQSVAGSPACPGNMQNFHESKLGPVPA